MKKLVFLIAILAFAFAGQAQRKQPYNQYGGIWKRLQVDSAMKLPTVPLGVKDYGGGLDTAQVYYSPADSSLKVYTGTQWITIGSVTSVPDTAFWRTNGNDFGAYSYDPILGTLDSTDIRFKTNGTLRLLMAASGIANDNADSNNVLVFEPTSKLLKYRPGSSFSAASGNNSYIQNQIASAQTANFWISNTGRFDHKREPTGTIYSDYFTGGGFGSGYDSSITNVVCTFNGSYLKDSVKVAGEGSMSNYITHTEPTGRQNWTQTVKFVAKRRNLQDYGIGLGLRSTNSFFSPDFFVHFIVRNNAGQNGAVALYLDGQTPGSPLFTTVDTVSSAIDDTLIATVSYFDGLITINYTNQSTGQTVDTSYNFGTASGGSYQAPNTGKFVLRFFGGVHEIFYWDISSTESKGSVLFRGNSITYGYTASEMDSTYPALIFSKRWQYEKNGGPGDRSADGVSNITELQAMRPKYTVLSLGVNDAQSGVSTSTYSTNIQRIIDSAQSVYSTVILLSNCPNNSVSVVPFNDTLQAIAAREGLKYINVYDSLRNGGTAWNNSYTTDNVHPNTAGHIIMARIIEREAPEILGDSSIFVNRPTYNPELTYFIGYNETNGQHEVGIPHPTDTSGAFITAIYRKTGTDSVYYVKGGVHIFAYEDSLGSGGGMTNPMTTTGDIIYSSSGTTPARRAIGAQGTILQVSNGLPEWKYDTTTLVTFTAGANFASDTALFTDSTIYGSFKLMGNDTFYVTGVSVVLYSNNAITDTLGIQITYNDTINVIGSHVFASTYAVNNGTTGQDADGDDFTGSNSVPIPPGNWVWLKSPTVVAGRKPYQLSVSIIGYKKRVN